VVPDIGKILLVDDRYDDDIKRAIAELVKRGMVVQYWNGEEPLPETIRNVRVVVLDLDLAGIGSRSGGFSDYSLAIKALHNIPGPYVVVILAQDFVSDDPDNLNNFYDDTYGPLCGFVAKERLSKAEEAADPSLLGKIIFKSINDTLRLIFLWEAVVDKAKDTAMCELFGGEVKETVSSLVKLLCLDVGQESAARELVSVVMQLVLRRTRERSEFSQMKTLINKLSKTQTTRAKYPTEEDLRLYNRLMFFKPDSMEDVWTGDIYRTTKVDSSKYDNYAIVLTPRCDLVHGKTSRIMVCYAFPLVEKYFDDPSFPLLKHDRTVVKRLENDKEKLLDWIRKRHPKKASLLESLLSSYPRMPTIKFQKEVVEHLEKTKKEFLKYMQQRYLEKGQFPEKLYTIWHFIEDDLAHPICFDLNNVESVELQHIEKWKRVCRLDSPFIEDMLEKYGALVSRIGVPNFNKSQKQLSIILKKS